MVLTMSPTSLRAAVVVQTLLLSPDQVNNHQEAVKATLHSLEGMLWVNSWRLGLLLAILELKKRRIRFLVVLRMWQLLKKRSRSHTQSCVLLQSQQKAQLVKCTYLLRMMCWTWLQR